jgi:hypothetical protein
MYTDKAVALRGKKSMKFDYEFESYKLENRVHRGIFEKKIRHAAAKKAGRAGAKRGPKPGRRGRPKKRAARRRRGAAAKKA